MSNMCVIIIIIVNNIKFEEPLVLLSRRRRCYAKLSDDDYNIYYTNINVFKVVLKIVPISLFIYLFIYLMFKMIVFSKYILKLYYSYISIHKYTHLIDIVSLFCLLKYC